MGGFFERWLANDGAVLRAWVVGHTPEALRELLGMAPLWALAIVAVLASGGTIWAGVTVIEKGIRGLRWVWTALTKPGKAMRDLVSPEPGVKQADIAGLKTQLAQVMAQLDRLTAGNVAAGGAPLGPEGRVRRDAAAAEIVAEATPASKAAVREIAAGDIAGAIDTLKRDARADMAAAAQKWRRLGALVRGASTAEARAAYEEAFKLEPEDFWTCIELARLRREAGDLAGAREVALAAEPAAHDERDRMVAAGEIGDVLREGGDLAGARARYEATLGIMERLARDNPGSASAQRDLSVSYNKLGDVLRDGGDLAGARARYEAGLGVGERLARDNPGSAEAQRDLSVSYERLGDVAERMEDFAAAIARYEQSQPIARRLAESNPSHPGLARDAEITDRRLAALRAKRAR